MPVRLALSNFADTRMVAAEPVSEPVAVLASADPAPVADYAPPPPVLAPVLADASSAIRSVALPMPVRGAGGVVPVTELPQPQPSGELILAETTPDPAAPPVADDGRNRPAQQQATHPAPRGR